MARSQFVSEGTSVLQLGRVLAPRVRDSIMQHASIALQVEIKKQARQLVSPKRDMVEVQHVGGVFFRKLLIMRFNARHEEPAQPGTVSSFTNYQGGRPPFPIPPTCGWSKYEDASHIPTREVKRCATPFRTLPLPS